MKKIVIFLLSLVMLAGCQNQKDLEPVNQDFLEELRTAMMELYYATDGPHWKTQPNWPLATIDDFDFVDFNNTTVDVDLYNVGLKGEVPASFFELPLCNVDLGDNYLHGNLPQNVGENGLLERFDVSNNELTGTLPVGLAQSFKVSVDCMNNKMSGKIPQEIVAECIKLENWRLDPQKEGYGFEAYEVVPPQDGDVATLKALYKALPENAQYALDWMVEDDPSQWNRVTWNGAGRCVELDLSDVEVISCPDKIAALTELKVLDMHRAELKDFPKVCGLEHLLMLDLSDNKMISFPEDFHLSPELIYLNLSFNDFNCPIPEAINRCEHLVYMDLNTNGFTGKFPAWDRFTEMKMLDVSDLERLDPQPLPEGFGNFKKLRNLFMYGSNFTGTIPASWANMVSMEDFEIYENQLDGECSQVFKNMKQLYYVDVEYNHLTGRLPEFNPEAKITSLYLGYNNFSGTIPETWSALSVVDMINLSDNAIEGNIPEFFAQLYTLDHFSCENNIMSGVIPEEVTKHSEFGNWYWKEQRGMGLTLPEEPSVASIKASTQIRPGKAAEKAARDIRKAEIAKEIYNSIEW